jgi:hypothetical protein
LIISAAGYPHSLLYKVLGSCKGGCHCIGYWFNDNLKKHIPFNLEGTIYKRFCIDLRIKLVGYPDTMLQKDYRRCSVLMLMYSLYTTVPLLLQFHNGNFIRLQRYEVFG